MKLKARDAGFSNKGTGRRSLFVAVALSLSVAGWGCGGSDGDGPTDPPNNPPPPPPAGSSGFSGSWDSTNLDEVGTPASRYVITQNGGTLTGDAYFRWTGVLERIGAITGTIAADGTFEWTVLMNDSGWEGTLTVTGKYTGSSNSVSGIAGLASAGPTILWKWFARDGSLNDEGSTELERPPTVLPTHGEGPLGQVGLWRGAVLLTSGGNCNAQGFAWTVGLDGGHGMWDPAFTDDDEFVGNVSGRRIPYDGVVNLTAANDFADFRGSIGGDVQGFALVTDEDNLEIEFQVVGGALAGVYLGVAVATQSSTVVSGTVTLDMPGCKDNFGLHRTGLFTLTAGSLTRP